MRTLFALLFLASSNCSSQICLDIDSTLNCFKRYRQKETRTIDENRTLLHFRCKTDTGKVDIFIDRDDRTPMYGKFLYHEGRPMRKSKIVSYKSHWLKKFLQIHVLGTNEIWQYSFLTNRWTKRTTQWRTGESLGTERPE